MSSMGRMVLAVAPVALAGCSLLYNPNNLPDLAGEAGVDAAPDVEVIADANPVLLELDSVAPAMIYEGQGDGGGLPALIVLQGHQIIDNNTTVEITSASGAAKLDQGAPVIAKNGNWIALPVRAHVDAALHKGTSVALTVTVTQTLPAEFGSGTKQATLTDKLVLVGLDELAAANVPMVGGKVNSPALDERYSKVAVSSAVTFGGAGRAVVRSMSDITMTDIDSTGANGGGNTVAGEAGGCGGGAPGSPSPCSGIGGAAGMSSGLGGGGGGGGGFAVQGTAGSGQASGMGGSPTGDERIATYDGFSGLSPNRPGGGGGGGPTVSILARRGGVAFSLLPGGGGAASGGSIELTADGNIKVGVITANGGTGQTSALAGGGGGGAGGLVMLRTGGTLTTTGAISVEGGPGGNSNGGAGAGGRVRWDAQAGSPAVAGTDKSTRTVHRGPSVMLPTQIFRTTTPSITVLGTARDQFDVTIANEGTVYTDGVFTIGDAGTGPVTLRLQQGLNHVCLTIKGAKLGASEADTCVDVAFLP
jgi:hypothetical protein